MNKVRVFGVDMSLNGSGVSCVELDKDTGAYEVVAVKAITSTKKVKDSEFGHYFDFYKIADSKSYAERMVRLLYMRDWIHSFIRNNMVDIDRTFVGIEDYAFAKQSNRVSEVHELGGLVKAELFTWNIPFKLYSPTLIKSVCGIKNANPKIRKRKKSNDMKEMSIKSVQEHFSLDLDLALDYNKDKRYGYDLADSLLVALTTMSDLMLHEGIHIGKTSSLMKTDKYPDGYYKEQFTRRRQGTWTVSGEMVKHSKT